MRSYTVYGWIFFLRLCLFVSNDLVSLDCNASDKHAIFCIYGLFTLYIAYPACGALLLLV